MVLWLRHEGVAVPERWQSAVAYVLEELEALHGVTPEHLVQIHEAKRIFGGLVFRDGDRIRVGDQTVINGLKTFAGG